MDGGTGSQLAWQSVPLDAGAQDVDDGLKGLSVRHMWPPSFRVRGGWGDQRLNLLPQLIADFPRLGSWHALLFNPFLLSLYHRFSDKFLAYFLLGFKWLRGEAVVEGGLKRPRDAQRGGLLKQ